MHHPDFYTQIPPIKLYDPLSDFLGTFDAGILEINYLDCVKFAGHSCPTVAGAYLMAVRGLKELYPNELPQRGSIKIEMQNAETDGTTGIVCNIISSIIGAYGVGGFKGIQGNFSRDNLVFFSAAIISEVKLTRLDTMQGVNLSYNISNIKEDQKMTQLMAKNLQSTADKKEKKLFQLLWQQRVQEILLNTDKHDSLITVLSEI
ncbi:MAG: hypothetical protein DRQ78_09590 [Epsilonproteobacteria bacterium]|nr:MAG: hypothetical protein DRQ78_09590 [Campylobacterota bacterium]